MWVVGGRRADRPQAGRFCREGTFASPRHDRCCKFPLGKRATDLQDGSEAEDATASNRPWISSEFPLQSKKPASPLQINAITTNVKLREVTFVPASFDADPSQARCESQGSRINHDDEVTQISGVWGDAVGDFRMQWMHAYRTDVRRFRRADPVSPYFQDEKEDEFWEHERYERVPILGSVDHRRSGASPGSTERRRGDPSH